MSRPLRIEFPGAVYHVTSRGNARGDIVLSDDDREMFLETLSRVVERFGWICHSYCLMTNHYHLLIETPESNLSAGMRQLNGIYTQRFNRRHSRVGHLFQGRYKAIMVERESYLLELCRYIVLNPVAAHMVDEASQWKWSSYRATAGEKPRPKLLSVDWLLGQFGGIREVACERYRRFVAEGVGKESVWDGLSHQVYLGSEGFVEQSMRKLNAESDLSEIPRKQRIITPQTIDTFVSEYSDRGEAMARAYLVGGFSMKDIAAFFGVHYCTVSRAVKKYEGTKMLHCKT